MLRALLLLQEFQQHCTICSKNVQHSQCGWPTRSVDASVGVEAIKFIGTGGVAHADFGIVWRALEATGGSSGAKAGCLHRDYTISAVRIQRTCMLFSSAIWFNAKFADEGLRAALLNTGDAIIEEAAPYDGKWGTGRNGKGLNLLGKCLMEVREFYKEDE